MGLAGRSVLAGADACDSLRRRPGRADLLGTAASAARWSISDRCATAISPPAASSSSSPTPFSMAPARRCPDCCSRSSATMRLSPGLVMSPAGFFAVMACRSWRLLGQGLDVRWLIAAGLLVMAAGSYWMSQMNLDIARARSCGPGWCLSWGWRLSSPRSMWPPTSISRGAAWSGRRAAQRCFATKAAASERPWRRRFRSAGNNSTCCGSTNISTRSIPPCVPFSAGPGALSPGASDPVLAKEQSLAGAGVLCASSRPRPSPISTRFWLMAGRDARAHAGRAPDETLGGRERRSHQHRMNASPAR